MLTPRAVKASKVTAAKAAAQADAIAGDDPVSRANRQRALAMARVAGKG